MHIPNDTIIAQATAVGNAGIGVIRISGDLVSLIAKKIIGKLPPKRYAVYTKLKNLNGETLDLGIAIFFPKPNSYTGEDVLELHTHGNQIILELLIKEILHISNKIRLAKAGEFTQRAFLNNKIDLIQAEAINDIIKANSEISLQYTLNNLTGKFSEALNIFFDKLITIKKYVEHLMSFENSELEYQQTITDCILHPLKGLIKQINEFIFNITKHLPIKKGFKVVLTGKPNVGKSSLFNAILGYERAIVTNLKGTTRDIISEFIYLNRLPIYIIDTAGIRQNVLNPVEKKGIELTMKELKEADCIIYIIDYRQQWNKEIDKIISELTPKIPVIFVINKIDLSTRVSSPKKNILRNKYPCIYLSTKPPKGLDLLLNNLNNELKKRYLLNKDQKSNFFANERQINYLNHINKHLKNVMRLIIEDQYSINDISAEELSIAVKKFDELFGKKIDSNRLLNEIFNTFCIGK